MGYKHEMENRTDSNGHEPALRDSPATLADDSLRLVPEALRILAEMTENLRKELPVELQFQFDPESPRTVLGDEDTRRVADGYLPTAWFKRAADASGPPSLQVAAMETPGPGLRWPGGKPTEPAECARVYEMHIDWLTEVAWRSSLPSEADPDIRG
jgi:hypothetical protein